MMGHVIPPFIVFAANRSTISGRGIKESGHVLQLVTMDG